MAVPSTYIKLKLVTMTHHHLGVLHHYCVRIVRIVYIYNHSLSKGQSPPTGKSEQQTNIPNEQGLQRHTEQHPSY